MEWTEVVLVLIILALLAERYALKKTGKLLKMKLEENGQISLKGYSSKLVVGRAY